MNNLTLSTTVAEFIEIIKKQKLSNVQVKEMLDNFGEVISKNVISDIYEAAGFQVVDARKKIFAPTENVNYSMQLHEAINIARSMRLEKDKQQKSLSKSVKEKHSLPVVVEPELAPEEKQFVGITHSNPFVIDRPEEAQDFILAALGLTHKQLDSIRMLIDAPNESPFKPIYEAIKQLGRRERTNKTYYISKDVIELVTTFTDDRSVKVSQFVEVALLDAIKKYQ